ncbi:MAG: hypothetical protein IKV45_05925 [Firmicutes bacterium]|nr:hypothetical protein [Bacillota bacterium]
MRILLQTITAFLLATTGFIILNNISQIPWEIMQYLWYAWLPCSAGAMAFCYGFSANRSGGSILVAAILLTPIILLSHKYQLPFATTITFPPTIIASALLTLPMEIIGKNLRKAHQKNTCQS